ncbi:hypothetical protein STAPHY8AQ_20687 [Staphylococcus sp. 8AQ]|nr:hypothetical protein STAPHY8AQ_20687 [Staphylococcus sp. 8AQ]
MFIQQDVIQIYINYTQIINDIKKTHLI